LTKKTNQTTIWNLEYISSAPPELVPITVIELEGVQLRIKELQQALQKQSDLSQNSVFPQVLHKFSELNLIIQSFLNAPRLNDTSIAAFQSSAPSSPPLESLDNKTRSLTEVPTPVESKIESKPRSATGDVSKPTPEPSKPDSSKAPVRTPAGTDSGKPSSTDPPKRALPRTPSGRELCNGNGTGGGSAGNLTVNANRVTPPSPSPSPSPEPSNGGPPRRSLPKTPSQTVLSTSPRGEEHKELSKSNSSRPILNPARPTPPAGSVQAPNKSPIASPSTPVTPHGNSSGNAKSVARPLAASGPTRAKPQPLPRSTMAPTGNANDLSISQRATMLGTPVLPILDVMRKVDYDQPIELQPEPVIESSVRSSFNAILLCTSVFIFSIFSIILK
jgi:hypothetical protein